MWARMRVFAFAQHLHCGAFGVSADNDVGYLKGEDGEFDDGRGAIILIRRSSGRDEVANVSQNKQVAWIGRCKQVGDDTAV